MLVLVLPALVKYMVHNAASIVAHLGLLCVATCVLKCASYPSKSWLALTMMELYAKRSLTRSGVRVAVTLTSVLKHSTQSSMQLIPFFCLILSDYNSTSSIVGPAGAPSFTAVQYSLPARSSQLASVESEGRRGLPTPRS